MARILGIRHPLPPREAEAPRPPPRNRRGRDTSACLSQPRASLVPDLGIDSILGDCSSLARKSSVGSTQAIGLGASCSRLDALGATLGSVVAFAGSMHTQNSMRCTAVDDVLPELGSSTTAQLGVPCRFSSLSLTSLADDPIRPVFLCLAPHSPRSPRSPRTPCSLKGGSPLAPPTPPSRQRRGLDAVFTPTARGASPRTRSLQARKLRLLVETRRREESTDDTSSQSEKRALPERPRNVHDFGVSQLEGRCLAHVLHTLLPTVGVSLEVLSAQQLSQIRRVALGTPRIEALAGGARATMDIGCLGEALRPAVREIVNAASKGSSDGCAFVLDCAAAGKPGNEDRLLAVPHFGSYYDVGGAGAGAADMFLACVCDGHGGHDTASTVRDMYPFLLGQALSRGLDVSTALEQAAAQTQALLQEAHATTHSQSGTTLTAVCVSGRRLHVANLGDSHAYVISSSGASTRLTQHHHVEDKAEQAAVLARGGEVYEVRGVLRVGGLCRVTRNLGLIQAGSAVGHTPSVSEYCLADDDAYLVVATDGLWDVMPPEEVAQIVLATGLTSACDTHAIEHPILSIHSGQQSLGTRYSSILTGPSCVEVVASSFCSSVILPDFSEGESSTSASSVCPKLDVASVLIEKSVAAGTKDNVGVIVFSLAR